MPARLTSFSDRNQPTRRVFCPDPQTVITTFEDYLPARDAIGKIDPGTRPDAPAKLCWYRPGYDYYAYLPKVRDFDGHLLEPLRHHKSQFIQRDGRWYADERTQ